MNTPTPTVGADPPSRGDPAATSIVRSSRDPHLSGMSVSGGARWLRRAPEIAQAMRRAPEVDRTWALVAFVGLLADPGLGWEGGHLSAAPVALAAVTSLPLVVRR